MADVVVVRDEREDLRLGVAGEKLTNPVAEARFACKVCEKEAGVVQLFGKPTAVLIHRESFVGTA